MDQLATDAAHHSRPRDKYIGVYIGILAVILAVCSLGGGNAGQDATLRNIEAANTWSFFQAKNARRQALRLEVDNLDIMLSVTTGLSDEARKKIETKMAEFREHDKKLTSDPEKQEGLDELWKKGKALEVQRDEALKRGPYFDYGQVMLQIAIVLASVALISGGNVLLIASFIAGALGSALTFGGFTMLFALPFSG